MTNQHDFNNDLLLVTGGGGGIGRSICTIAAERGCRVIAADIRFDRAQETIASIPDSSKHMALEMNVTIISSIEESFQKIHDHYSGCPNLLVNCAGVSKTMLFHQHTELDFNDIINVNLKGTFLVSQAYLKSYRELKLNQGSIVNLGSIAGKNGSPSLSIYAAAKAAIEAFSKSTSKEVGSLGIRVNCVRPGLIETKMSENTPPHLLDYVMNNTVMKRQGKPQEVAELVLFLLSERSSYMTGGVVDVGGGL